MTADSNQALINSWQLSLHDKAPGTRDLYRKQLGHFCAWLTTTTHGDLLEASRGDVESWLTHMRDAGKARATIHNRWIALRSFYAWCVEEDEIDVNPMAKVKAVRVGNDDPVDFINADELDLVLKACTGRGFLERRDMALIRFIAATGVRRAEAAALTLPDVDLEARVALVHGKGDRVRAVRFDPKTAASIDRYTRVRARHRLAASPRLWLAQKGALTPAGVAQVVERRGELAGIGHIHPHQLRHAWADRAKRSGMSDEAVMMLGGWRSADVMRRYGQALAAERALAAYDQYDPMGDL